MAKRSKSQKSRHLQPANLFATDGELIVESAAETAIPHPASDEASASTGSAERPASPSPPGPLPNLIQEASAGTGKTFSLSNRYLLLLVGGAAPESILASTFTRKGAGEILDRILSRLGAAAVDDKGAAKLAHELGLSLTRAQAIGLLRKLVACLPTLQIGTLDSYFNRIARAFCFELGLPPDWSVVDVLRARILHEQAIEAILGEEETPQLLKLMSKADADRRVADLIARTVEELFVIYRDATPEAWEPFGNPQPVALAEVDEVAEALEQVEGLPTRIAEYSLRLATELRAGNWEEAAGLGLVKKVRAGESHYYRQEIPESSRAAVRRADQLIARQITWLVATRTRATRDLLARFDAALQPLQLESGELEFADVTFFLARAIQLQPEEIARRLGHRTEHLLLDEFQDTAPQQWAVLKPLAEHVTQPDSGRTFFCVGDRKQAIYGWRGGESRIFEAIRQGFGQRVNEAPQLVESYRSSNSILAFVNTVFGNFGALAESEKEPATRAVLREWVPEFKEHTAANRDLPGYAEVRQVAAAEELDHEAVMLQATAAEVARLHSRYPGKEIAVLLRGNKPIARLAHLLQQAGIPTSEEAGNPLTDAAAVEVCLSALTLADHPGDSVARFHVSHTPLGQHFGLEPEVAGNQRANQQRAQEVAAAIRRQLLDSGYGPTLRQWARILGQIVTEREAQRLEQLVEVAYAYDSSWTLRPRRFVDYLREQRVADRTGASVRLMTMHAAKGLGFDLVVAPLMKKNSGWTGSHPPVVTRRRDPAGRIDLISRFVRADDRPLLPAEIEETFETYQSQQVNEELCLLYVTLTRAKQHLSVLVSPQAKAGWDNEVGVLLRAIADQGSADPETGLLAAWGNPDWLSAATSQIANLAPPASQPADMPGDSQRKSAPLLILGSRTGRGQEWLRPSGETRKTATPSSKAAPATASAEPPSRPRRTGPVRSRELAQQLGSASHLLLQQVVWQETPPTRETLLGAIGSVIAEPKEREQLVDQFLKRLGRGDWADWFSESSLRAQVLERHYGQGKALLEPIRLDVRRELPFVLKLDRCWLEGQIDRLVLVQEGDRLVAAELVDFKTGSVRVSELATESLRYRRQLGIYRRAVQQLFGLGPEAITTSLVFTSVDDGSETATSRSVSLDEPADAPLIES